MASRAARAAPAARRARPADVERHLGALARLHEAMRAGDARRRPRSSTRWRRSTATTGCRCTTSFTTIASSPRLCAEYDAHQPETSFIDYFWTVRTMHVPLFKLAAHRAARCRAFRALHAVSTGYAGFARRARCSAGRGARSS